MPSVARRTVLAPTHAGSPLAFRPVVGAATILGSEDRDSRFTRSPFRWNASPVRDGGPP
jgi:hypothetical protein